MSRSTTNTLIINKLALAASVDTSPGLALVPNPGTSEYIELSVTTSRGVGELVQTPIEPSEFPIGPTTITQIDDLSDNADISMGQLVEVRQEPSLQVTNLAKVGNLIISTPAPVDPIGEFGDVVGMMRAGDDGIYYCSADFNGVDEIWKFARFVPSPIGWDDVNDKPQIIAAGSTIEEARDAIGLGTLVMADITDKQGKVLDDPVIVSDGDMDSLMTPGGYLFDSNPDNGYLVGTVVLVSAVDGYTQQMFFSSILGAFMMRYHDGADWQPFVASVTESSVQQWYNNTTADPPNAVINSDGTFSRSTASHNPNPLLDVIGTSHSFVNDNVNKYVRYTAAGAKTATFDSGEGFAAGGAFHITNRAVSGNITISGTGVTFNTPKNGTLVLEPGDTVTVKFISPTEADVIAYVGGGAANLPTDNDFDNVSALLHFNGPQGSTAIGDSSKLGQAITTSGSIFIDQAQSVFGGASLRCGAGMATIPSIELGNGDYTIEFWIRINALPTAQVGVMGNSTAGGNIWFIGLGTAGNLFLSEGNMTYPPNLSAGVWYHIAFVRLNGSLYSYLNGIRQVQTGTSTTAIPSIPVFIGAYDNSTNRLDGWIDELRITPNIARYTKSFTVPNKEYPNAAP